MNKIAITTETKTVLKTLVDSIDPMKIVNDLIDNAIQYGKCNLIKVLINEAKSTLTIVDAGDGFHDITWSNYHKIFVEPEDKTGCSKYGIGSKPFGAIAKSRLVFSNSKNGKAYHSRWDYPNVEAFPLEDVEKAQLWSLIPPNSTGTVVQLQNCNFKTRFQAASKFYKDLKKCCVRRYSHKLYKTNQKIKIIFTASTEKASDDHIIVGKDCLSAAKHLNHKMHSNPDGTKIEYYSFISPDSISVGQQGIEVYYDDFLISVIPWQQFKARHGLIIRATHNLYNCIRQKVFLSSINSKSCKIDINKTDCALPHALLVKLASDFLIVDGKRKTVKKQQFNANPASIKPTRKFRFEVSSNTEEFNDPTFLGTPFRRDKNNKIYINSDTMLHEVLSEMPKKYRELICDMVESLYSCRDSRVNRRSDGDFIKEFSKLWENTIQ